MKSCLSKSEHGIRQLLGGWLGVTNLERSIGPGQEFILSPFGTRQMERLGRGQTHIGLGYLEDVSGRNVEDERKSTVV